MRTCQKPISAGDRNRITNMAKHFWVDRETEFVNMTEKSCIALAQLRNPSLSVRKCSIISPHPPGDV